jgi:hypothetical protein
MKQRIVAALLTAVMVLGGALPAYAHTATHFHGGRTFVNFHTDTSTSASDVNMFGCSQIGGLARRWENQRHWVRQNSTAPWSYSHETIANGSWFWGSC